MKRGLKVFCPNCSQEFNISKSASEGDTEQCPHCTARLEVIKKNKKIDVRLLEHQDESVEIEMTEEPEFEDYEE
ncbi:MAG: hypothetical protein QXO69_01900 [archaeon]